MITPQLIGLTKTAQLPYASSLCGACREVCPVKIDIPELLLHLRAEITEPRSAIADPVKQRRSERLSFKLWAAAMMRPRLYELSSKLLRLLQPIIVRRGKIGKVAGLFSWLAPPLAAWTAARDLRPIEKRSFREQWRERIK